MDPYASLCDHPLRFDEVIQDAGRSVSVHTRAFDDALVVIHIQGRGSRAGMRSAACSFERGFECFPVNTRFRVIVDLEGFDGAPLAAQFTLVRWLFSAQSRLDQIGIIHGTTFALRAARAVKRCLPFGDIIEFFDDAPALLSWIAPS